LHIHVRPPASYGILCSKSQFVAGLRQPGPVHVACPDLRQVAEPR
jgi:hypothetical protein